MRKVAVFTGNRAEYGLQFPILKAIEEDPFLEYQLIVSGGHLESNFGNTLREIEEDGFRIDAQVKIELEEDSSLATAKAIGGGIIRMADVLHQLAPDILVVYADRFEGFAAIVAASQMNIPVAHIEGGDLTEGGALDDSVRHAMTKLSHLHFTTNKQAYNRVLALGEEAWRVENVGLPANDVISCGHYTPFEEVVAVMGLDLSRPIIIFTQHSVSTEFAKAEMQIMETIKALKSLINVGVQVIVTYPNNDVGGAIIIKNLRKFWLANKNDVTLRKSLGRKLYHGLLALAEDKCVRLACVGNSSSGIKETPFFSCPTVNIGTRQEGRLRGKNVIDVDYDSGCIQEAINKCLFDEDFRRVCRDTDNPYFLTNSGSRVAKKLASVDLGSVLIRKKMTLAGEEFNGWFR